MALHLSSDGSAGYGGYVVILSLSLVNIGV